MVLDVLKSSNLSYRSWHYIKMGSNFASRISLATLYNVVQRHVTESKFSVQVLKYWQKYNTCTFKLKILWGALENYGIVFWPVFISPCDPMWPLMTPPSLPLKRSQHFWMTFDANSCIYDLLLSSTEWPNWGVMWS